MSTTQKVSDDGAQTQSLKPGKTDGLEKNLDKVTLNGTRKSKTTNSWIRKFLATSYKYANLIVLLFAVIQGYLLTTDSTEYLSMPARYVTLLYLLSFITHFGTQLWMTFISGVTLYFGLPRHVFGQVQVILFPVYFLFSSIASMTTLITWLNHPQRGAEDHYKQTLSIVLCFWMELVILIYIAPSIVSTYSRKTGIEEEVGVGKEVGHYNPGPLRSSAQYKAIHWKFRKLHVGSTLLNIVAVICNSYHFTKMISILSDGFSVTPS